MNERAKQLMGELFNEFTNTKPKSPANGTPPSGVTRNNLNQIRGALAGIVGTCTFEQEFTTGEVLDVGDAFFAGLQDVEASLGKPGEAMSWQEVREVFSRWFIIAANALTPAGVAKTIAVMKQKQAANVATPAANAAKSPIQDLHAASQKVVDKLMTPSLN